MNSLDHTNICVCTYRRPELLRRLLSKLSNQETLGLFTYSIIVVDNDHNQTARVTVTELTAQLSTELLYCVEDRRNIALARNRAIAHARGNFVAFIDDDEYPANDWLITLWKTCKNLGVDGVLGPVLPHFESEPAQWVMAGGFYDRPRHHTGFRMDWLECRTGNVLVRREVIDQFELPFRAEFATGGEDQDFFRRAMERQHQFVWCDEALVYEWIPMSRVEPGFLLRRALLRGNNSLRHPRGRARNILKSIIAVPVYCLAIPILVLGQRQHSMKYCVKLMDHFGRLLALIGCNPITQRPM